MSSARVLAIVITLSACGDHASVPLDGNADASPDADGSLGSRCEIAAMQITCDHATTSLDDSTASRDVAYEVPLGVAPASGWPAVIFYQGSFVTGTSAFAAQVGAPFGEYNLTLTIKALLDGGYAVIAPNAAQMGSTFWETNVPPYSTSWTGSPDDVLVTHMLAAIGAGTFGTIDPARLYAMGISSGGFMTSRMAVSYPGVFRALADHSGSYATCSAICAVPTPLPADHPPVLFLHGDTDAIVPMSAVQPYFADLQAEGIEAQLVTDPNAGHEWLAAGVITIPAWFTSHP
ncbi:MAG: prolyl oligopeptidase family serine peptidase [Deltaproteobacteria bacterium]